MKIEERIQRDCDEDKIEIGKIVERITTGENGTVLRLIIEGIKSIELARCDSKVPADRILGRLESLSMLQDKLDMAVGIMQQLTQIQKESNKVSGDLPQEG